MFDITKDVVQVSIARIPMEIVGTGFCEHLGERIREHTRSQGVQGCFLFCDDGQCLSMRACDLLCFFKYILCAKVSSAASLGISIHKTLVFRRCCG